jgi:hypothetical protein
VCNRHTKHAQHHQSLTSVRRNYQPIYQPQRAERLAIFPVASTMPGPRVTSILLLRLLKRRRCSGNSLSRAQRVEILVGHSVTNDGRMMARRIALPVTHRCLIGGEGGSRRRPLLRIGGDGVLSPPPSPPPPPLQGPLTGVVVASPPLAGVPLPLPLSLPLLLRPRLNGRGGVVQTPCVGCGVL